MQFDQMRKDYFRIRQKETGRTSGEPGRIQVDRGRSRWDPVERAERSSFHQRERARWQGSELRAEQSQVERCPNAASGSQQK